MKTGSERAERQTFPEHLPREQLPGGAQCCVVTRNCEVDWTTFELALLFVFAASAPLTSEQNNRDPAHLQDPIPLRSQYFIPDEAIHMMK